MHIDFNDVFDAVYDAASCLGKENARTVFFQQMNKLSQGWVFNTGYKECPVPDGTDIEVIYRCGDMVKCKANDSHSFSWDLGSEHIGGYDSMDIIAWRIAR